MGSTVPEVIARAKQLIAERKHQEAVRACRRVLLARPDEAQVRLLLAQALLALERHDEVRIEMLSQVRKTPDSAAAHRLLGEACMRLGRTEDAKQSLLAALRLDPSDDEARDLLEELGASPDELPPEMGTIDRWFAAEATTTEGELPPLEGEATTASVVLPDPSASVGATSPFDDRTDEHDPRVHTGPSVQLDPELAAESTSVSVPELPPRGPRAPAPSILRAPAPSIPRAPAPSIPRAPAPSVPRAPAPRPMPRPRPPVADLPSESTSELEPGDLELLPSDSTQQLDSLDLEPLPEEPTRAKPMIPGVPDFGDETTRGARLGARRKPFVPPSVSAPEVSEAPVAAPPGRSFTEDAPGATTEHRPRVDAFDFPSDAVDTGLPPLDGEATAARAAPIPEPIVPGRTAPLPAGAGPDDSVRPPPPGIAPLGAAPMATPIGPPPGVPTEPPPPPAPPAPLAPPPAPPPTAAEPASRAKAALAAVRARVEPARERLEQAIVAKTGSTVVPTRVWVALAGIPVLGLVLLIVLARAVFAGGDAEEALALARQAADDGLLSSTTAALAFEREEGLDDPDDQARQAWLQALGAMEHGADTEAGAESSLAALGDEAAGQPLARIARIYLALEQGAVDEAATFAQTVAPPSLAGEDAHARALVALLQGDTEAAVQHARQAQTARPSSARYAALLARVMAVLGESEPALQLTGGVAGAEGSPVVRLARVEAHAARGDWAPSLSEAEAVFGALAELASPRQEAVAHLGAARALAEQGEDAQAREHLAAAAENRPPMDEAYGLALAEIFLEIGSPQDARTFIDALPERVANAHRRAQVAAEVYLAQDDLEALESVLDSAADSPRTAFLRGRLAEAKDAIDDAKRFYEAAAVDEHSRPEAMVRLGAIALEEDRVDDAIDRLESAVEAVPGDGEAVALLARAHLEDGDADEAGEVIERGLQASPDDPSMLLARADVELADDRPEAAMRTLESLVERRPNDADLHSSLGEAARRMGDLERAGAAFGRALELRPGDRTALLGKALLAVEAQDVEAAEAAIEAAEAGGVTGRRIDLVKGRLMVLQGRGLEAERALGRLMGRRTRDAALLAAYGWAQAQAEDYRGAKRSFERALRVDDDAIEAHLGMALVETRLGDLRAASQAVGAAERIVRARDLGPRYQARVAVARGRVRFEYGSFGDAREHAEEAIEKDGDSAEAHFLMAMIADANGDDPERHLRRAAEGRMPPPEVFGQLVIHSRGGRERCEMGRRYLAAAPRGIDASDVRRAIRRCR